MPHTYSPNLSAWITPDATGPIVPRMDFPETSEITSIAQPYAVLATYYAAPTMSAVTAYGGVSFYLTGDSGHSSDGPALRFVREWARIPSDREIWGSEVREHPGSTNPILGGADFPTRNLNTRTRTTYRYYLPSVNVTSGEDVPLSEPFRVYLSVSSPAYLVDVGMILSDDTQPTIASYNVSVSNGEFLTSADELAPWKGEILERRTVEFIAL